MEGFLIFPDQVTTYIADKTLPWEYIWIEFDGLRVKSILESVGLTADSPIYHPQDKNLREEMAHEMQYPVQNRDASPFHLIGHFYLFLDYLMRSAAKAQVRHAGKLRDDYVHEALNYVEQHFQNDITVEDIAAVCGLNRTYFSKIFKEALGKTPQEFFINYRMLKAVELLKLTDLSIGDIGLAVGYANLLHFSRAFKNSCGISPRAWRNQNRIVHLK